MLEVIQGRLEHMETKSQASRILSILAAYIWSTTKFKVIGLKKIQFYTAHQNLNLLTIRNRLSITISDQDTSDSIQMKLIKAALCKSSFLFK